MHARRLGHLVFPLLVLCLIVSVALLSTRSIWIDEAMLLKSVYEMGIPHFLHPLPYYNQASPFIPSVIIKLISMIAGTNFILFRILLFVAVSLCAAPLLLKLVRTCGTSALLTFLLVLNANTFIILFNATEIKHYGFEVAAVSLFLYWLLTYIDNPGKALSPTYSLIPLCAVTMGFSSLLLVPAFFLFFVLDTMTRLKQPSVVIIFGKNHAFFFLMMIATAAIVYFHMKHLTIYQIENSWSLNAYGSKGISKDFYRLGASAYNAYGEVFFPVSIIATLFVMFENKNNTLFRLNLFFLSSVSVVTILKLIGLYPVIYARHVVWLVPVSMTVTVLLLHHLLSSDDKRARSMAVVTLTLLCIAIGINFKIFNQGFFHEEHSNNFAMYSRLANLPPSDVFVSTDALPSLQIYGQKIGALRKHRYYRPDRGEERSEIKPPHGEDGGIKWNFREIMPQTDSFLFLLSHAHHMHQEPPHSWIVALRDLFRKNDCAYESIFEEYRVQILKVSCAKPEQGESGAGV